VFRAGTSTSGAFTWATVPDPDGSPTATRYQELAYDDNLVSPGTAPLSGVDKRHRALPPLTQQDPGAGLWAEPARAVTAVNLIWTGLSRP
jgi:hypothetical protein